MNEENHCGRSLGKPVGLAFLGCFLLLWGLVGACSHSRQVLVPPKFDLSSYQRIGVVAFASNTDTDLGAFATQNFMQAIQSAQPGTAFLELGEEGRLLAEVNRAQLDIDALKAIGEHYRVDAIVYGHLNISPVKPKLRVSSALQTLKAQAYIEAVLNTKIYEADSGATLWTQSAADRAPFARISLSDKGPVSFGASDPREKYGPLVESLVYRNTDDFRPHYVTVRE